MNRSSLSDSQSGSLNNFMLAWLVLLIPGTELLVLRLWLKYQLDLRPGLPGFVDADIILPALLSYGVLIYLGRSEGWTHRFSTRSLWINLASVGSLVLLCTLAKSSAKEPAFVLAFWSLTTAILVSGMDVLLPVRQFFSSTGRRISFSICTLAAFTVVIVKNFPVQPSKAFFSASGNFSCALLTSLTNDARCDWFDDGHLFVKFGQVAAFLGPGCFGTDALILMGFCLLAFTIFTKHKFSTKQFVGFWLIGICFAFVVNHLRIVALFVAGHTIARTTNSQITGQLALEGLFHTHLGWVLYAVSFVLFFKWLSIRRPALKVQPSGT